MRKCAITAVVTLFLTGIVLALAINFADSYDAALKQAGDSNKKLLITFTSPT